jgi:AcrR family transcriptional regulator
MSKSRVRAPRPRGGAVVEAVLTQTLTELADHGPDGLNIDRIARQAQVNRTTIYRRWPTREELIRAALSHSLHAFDPIPDTGSLRGDLRMIAQQIDRLIDAPHGQALLRAAASPASGDTIARFAAQAATAATRRPARQLSERARARGEWQANITPEQVIFTLVGAIWHRRSLEGHRIDNAWLDPLLDLLTRGVRDE